MAVEKVPRPKSPKLPHPALNREFVELSELRMGEGPVPDAYKGPLHARTIWRGGVERVLAFKDPKGGYWVTHSAPWLASRLLKTKPSNREASRMWDIKPVTFVKTRKRDPRG